MHAPVQAHAHTSGRGVTGYEDGERVLVVVKFQVLPDQFVDDLWDMTHNIGINTPTRPWTWTESSRYHVGIGELRSRGFPVIQCVENLGTDF